MKSVRIAFIIVLFFAVNGDADELPVQDDPAKAVPQADTAIQPQDVIESELRTLLQYVSGGVAPLVAQLFREHKPSATELDEIRQLIRQAETRLERKPRR